MAVIAERIGPIQAREHLESDADSVLVCAYDDPKKFEENHLEGAISLAEFESQVGSMPLGREIIFYCA